MSRYDDQVDALAYAWRWLKTHNPKDKSKMNDKKYTIQISTRDLCNIERSGPSGETVLVARNVMQQSHAAPMTEAGLRVLAEARVTPYCARVAAKAKLAEIEAERAQESNAKDLEAALSSPRTLYSPGYCKPSYQSVGLIAHGGTADCHVYYASNAVEAQLWLETPAMFKLLERCRAVLAKLPHGTGIDEYADACELIDRIKTGGAS